ncbi:MAG: DUF3232 domain-containing protein [Candidatus Nanoarchaeia archaeon]
MSGETAFEKYSLVNDEVKEFPEIVKEIKKLIDLGVGYVSVIRRIEGFRDKELIMGEEKFLKAMSGMDGARRAFHNAILHSIEEINLRIRKEPSLKSKLPDGIYPQTGSLFTDRTAVDVWMVGLVDSLLKRKLVKLQ